STTDGVISTTTSMTTSMVSGNTIAFQRSIAIRWYVYVNLKLTLTKTVN
ncbi:unnamed protein product, partial [Rotaria magnacalcarata]